MFSVKIILLIYVTIEFLIKVYFRIDSVYFSCTSWSLLTRKKSKWSLVKKRLGTTAVKGVV